jgi:hypothetical protein
MNDVTCYDSAAEREAQRDAQLEEIHSALWKLHEGVARELLKQIRAGKAKAALISVARDFLRDNGIAVRTTYSMAEELERLANEELPFPEEEFNE